MTDDNFFLTPEWIQDGIETEGEFCVGGYLHKVNSQTKQFKVKEDAMGHLTGILWVDENGNHPVEMDVYTAMDFLEGYEIYRDGIDTLLTALKSNLANENLKYTKKEKVIVQSVITDLENLRKK